jgi:hypothetical protein
MNIRSGRRPEAALTGAAFFLGFHCGSKGLPSDLDTVFSVIVLAGGTSSQEAAVLVLVDRKSESVRIGALDHGGCMQVSIVLESRLMNAAVSIRSSSVHVTSGNHF